MTSTPSDSDDMEKTTQMAEALIAHLGTPAAASIFADRQRSGAQGAALETWTAISVYLERYRDDR
jgi:hypothetical protein